MDVILLNVLLQIANKLVYHKKNMLAINLNNKCLLILDTHVISLRDIIQGFCYVEQNATKPLQYRTATHHATLSLGA
jgi:hypothetical protein